MNIYGSLMDIPDQKNKNIFDPKNKDIYVEKNEKTPPHPIKHYTKASAARISNCACNFIEIQ